MAETPLDRRRILALGAMGSVAALASSWLAACGRSDGERRPDDGQGHPGDAGSGSGTNGGAGISDAPATRAEAADRARARGRPLLVLVVPADERRQYEVGSVLGSFLTHGDDEALADVACCEVTCMAATLLEERGHSVGPNTWMILTEGDRTVPIVAALPPRPEFAWREFEGMEAYDRAYEEAVRAEIRTLASGLRAALIPSRAHLKVRAAITEATLSTADRAAAAEVIAGRSADAGLVARAAALLRLAAETNPAERTRLMAVLAADARRRLEQAPAGSRWGENYGCGIHVEGEPDPTFACGMGHVPKIGARFLALWTAR